MLMKMPKTKRKWTYEVIEGRLIEIVKELDRVPSAYEVRQVENALYHAMGMHGGITHWKEVMNDHVVYCKKEETQTQKELKTLMQHLNINTMPTGNEIKEYDETLYNRILKYGGNLKGYMNKYKIGNYNGRIDFRRIRLLHDQGLTAPKIAREIGCSSESVYVYTRELKAKRNKMHENKLKEEAKKSNKVNVKLGDKVELVTSIAWLSGRIGRIRGKIIGKNSRFVIMQIRGIEGTFKECFSYWDLNNAEGVKVNGESLKRTRK